MSTLKFAAVDARASGAEAAQVPAAAALTVDVLLVLRRQRWPLMVCALAGLALGVLHYATSPKAYYAAATILVHEEANDPGREFLASLPLMRNETAVLNEMQILRSLQLAEQVTRELNLHDNPDFMRPSTSLARRTLSAVRSAVSDFLPQRDEVASSGNPSDEARILGAAAILQRDVGVQRVGRSFSIEISMILQDPALAAAIANSYARNYLSDRQDANRLASDRGVVWLRTHIEEVRESANEAAKEAADFRAKNKASDVQGLRELEQRSQTLNSLHATLLGRLEMIAIEGSYPATNGRLLSQAVAPRFPALPKSWRILAAGLVIGLLGGLGVATVRELRETGVRTGEDIRLLTGLPFLGFMPRFNRAKIDRLRPVPGRPSRDRSLRFSSSRPGSVPSPVAAATPSAPAPAAVAKMPAHFVPSLCLSAVVPDAPCNETLKNVLASIDRRLPPGGRVIAIGSLNAGEGRSTLAANLAHNSAIEGRRTLLIDADMFNPGLSRLLDYCDGAGLHEVLSGDTELQHAVVELPVTGLHFLPCVPPSGLSIVPGHERFAQLLARVRTTYDCVVIDARPMATSSDIKAILPSIDAVVLVAEWGRTPRAALEDYMANETDVSRKVVGTVMNKTVMRQLGAYGVDVDPGRLRGDKALA